MNFPRWCTRPRYLRAPSFIIKNSSKDHLSQKSHDWSLTNQPNHDVTSKAKNWVNESLAQLPNHLKSRSLKLTSVYITYHWLFLQVFKRLPFGDTSNPCLADGVIMNKVRIPQIWLGTLSIFRLNTVQVRYLATIWYRSQRIAWVHSPYVSL